MLQNENEMKFSVKSQLLIEEVKISTDRSPPLIAKQQRIIPSWIIPLPTSSDLAAASYI